MKGLLGKSQVYRYEFEIQGDFKYYWNMIKDK